MFFNLVLETLSKKQKAHHKFEDSLVYVGGQSGLQRDPASEQIKSSGNTLPRLFIYIIGSVKYCVIGAFCLETGLLEVKVKISYE